jgi:hypothetical protein
MIKKWALGEMFDAAGNDESTSIAGRNLVSSRRWWILV